MVVTRRSRSLQGSDDAAEERAPLLGRQQQQRPPLPPPPPPMMQNNNNNVSNNNNNNVVDIDARSNDVNPTNNRNSNPETVQPPAAMMNSANQNSDTIDIQYLQVRVPPPKQMLFNMLRPFHIHRRKRSSSPTSGAPPRPNAPMQRRESNNSNTGSRKNASNNALSKQQQAYTDGEIVRILIPPNGFASERQLAECLSQAGEMTTENGRGGADFDEYRDDVSWDSMDEYYDYNHSKPMIQAQPVNVAGMFRESDRVFIPLSVIYSNPISFVGDVLSLKRPPPPVRRPSVPPPMRVVKPQRSIFIQFLEVFGIVAVVIVSWWSYSAACYVDWDHFFDSMITKFELFVWSIVSLPFWLFDVLVEFPLRELYRYGPSVVGWEGEPLPRICAQITYTGDEGFWSRNIEECERIYRAKEDAAMLFRKPLLVSLVVVVIFYMVKSIVAARALRQRERIDPNMVETFRAINMLSRQLRRAMNTR